ncbi:glycosyltransferase family 4 protein [Patescibacteria group bacterium]
MKICVDGRMYGKGFTGIGRYIQELLSHLAKIDQEDQYLVLLSKGNFNEFNIKQPNFKKELADFGHYSLDEQTKFLKHLKKKEVDLIHFPHFNLPIFYRKPFVITIHDLIHTLFPGKNITRFPHRLAYDLVFRSAVKHAKKIIAVSENTKKDLVEIMKADPDKIEVIYEAVDDKYYPIEDHKKLSDLKAKYKITKPFLFYIGNWRYHKNVHGLVEAFNIIKDQYKIDCQLVLPGKMGRGHQEEAENAINNSPFKSDIILPGFIPEEELPILYNAATIFTFPSFYEGFGLPPLEAMACATPVVSSNAACMPEILGDASKYFDPNNTEEMAKKIAEVLKSENLQKEMSKQGPERTKQYSWERMAKETLNVYKNIINN